MDLRFRHFALGIWIAAQFCGAGWACPWEQLEPLAPPSTVADPFHGLPNLRAIHGPLKDTVGERGLDGWRGLTEGERKLALRDAVEKNANRSRTATVGRSNKGFSEIPEVVRARAMKNLFEAFRLTSEHAGKRAEERDTADALYRLMRRLNGAVTKELSGQLPKGDRLEPGELRWVPAKGEASAADRTAEKIRSENESALRDFCRRLSDRLANASADPMEVAAWAYLELSENLKPFADGNGRTGQALIQFLMLRAGYPIPTYSDLGHTFDPVTLDHQGGGFDEAILAWRRRAEPRPLRVFLDESVKETIRLALRNVRPTADEVIASFAGGHEALGESVRPLGQGRNAAAHLALAADGTPVSVKVATSVGAFANLRAEAELVRRLPEMHILTEKQFARLHAAHPEGRWIAKAYIDGPSGAEVLKKGPLTPEQVGQLELLFQGVRELSRQRQIHLDFQPTNVVWSASERTWVFIDLGPAFYEPPFMKGSFADYLSTQWARP